MKNLNQINIQFKSIIKNLLFWGIFSITNSCKEPLINANSKMSAIKDSKDWNAEVSYGRLYKSTNRIILGGNETIVTKTGKYEEFLLIEISFFDLKNPKSVKLKKADLNYIVGGDAIFNSFLIDTLDTSNRVSIIKIDKNKKIINGTFNLKLFRDKIYASPNEAVELKAGNFEIYYKEYN